MAFWPESRASPASLEVASVAAVPESERLQLELLDLPDCGKGEGTQAPG